MLQAVNDADDLRECARRLVQLVMCDTGEMPPELIEKIRKMCHELEMTACELDR